MNQEDPRVHDGAEETRSDRQVRAHEIHEHDADVWPLDLTSGVTGTVKALALSDTKKGIHGCAKKVKPEGTTADTGVKPVERCK